MQFSRLALAVCLAVTAAQAQRIAPGGVLNGASFAEGQPVSPGSLVTIFGDALAAATISGSTVPLSTNINQTSVTFNGIAAPLYFVSEHQVNVELPWGLPTTGTVSIVVKFGSSSAPFAVSMANFSPGVFSIPAGAGWAVAINNADGSLAAPVGAIPGVSTHPAKAGDALIVYADGLGPVDSIPADGAASMDMLRHTLTTPTVLIGSKQAQVVFSGLTPQFPGVNQLNVVVPSGLTGTVPFQIQVGGFTTTDKVTVAVQ